MDSSSACNNGAEQGVKEIESLVDPFLVEALQNPRHRLTILRMELDIQKFLQDVDQQVFEFQHFPTSYLRLAAHRVSQHYGLQTMVLDTGIEGQGRILVKKIMGWKYPMVSLSAILAKQPETGKLGHIKIAIKPRPNNAAGIESKNCDDKKSAMRSVEERLEDYDKARARIFSSFSSSDSYDILSDVPTVGNSLSLRRDESHGCRIPINEMERNIFVRDAGPASRVAILRDREKDRSDPDYDRSYKRYVSNVPMNQSVNFTPFTMQKLHPPLVQLDTGYPPFSHMPTTQTSYGYGISPNLVMSPLNALGLNQTTGSAAYVQWPGAEMMYAHNVFQAPFWQQPLSFDYSQSH